MEELRNMGVVKSVVQKVWERSSWDTRVAEQVPNTVFHFCLNNFPEDFKESGSGSRHWGTILDKVLTYYHLIILIQSLSWRKCLVTYIVSYI